MVQAHSQHAQERILAIVSGMSSSARRGSQIFARVVTDLGGIFDVVVPAAALRQPPRRDHSRDGRRPPAEPARKRGDSGQAGVRLTPARANPAQGRAPVRPAISAAHEFADPG